MCRTLCSLVMKSKLYNVECTGLSVYCALCNVHTVYCAVSLYSALCKSQCLLCTVQCAMCSVFNVQCAVHSVYNVHRQILVDILVRCQGKGGRCCCPYKADTLKHTLVTRYSPWTLHRKKLVFKMTLDQLICSVNHSML